MRIIRIPTAVLVAALCALPPPAQARQAKPSPLAGWWGYDKACPASDDGFALAPDGSASDGSGAYTGRWSLQENKLTIVWNATQAERAHIERSKWRIIETFTLVRQPQQRAALENVVTHGRAWLCRKYR